MGKRLKILVSAYACEPGKGSEPGSGWYGVKKIAPFNEVWVITRANNREAIENTLPEDPMPNIHWVYYDLPAWMRFWKKGGRGVQLYYFLWQLGLYFVAKKLHARVGFDVVHHITFATYWKPSLLGLLPVPFVWGPVGGGESAPKSFYRTMTIRGRMYERVRDLGRALARWIPFVRTCARRARVTLVTTEETAECVRRLGSSHVQVFPHIGITSEEVSKLSTFPARNGSIFRLVSIGSMIDLKGYHMSLTAFGQFQQSNSSSEYWLVGDGLQRKRLERLADGLGIRDKVRFLGHIPRIEALETLVECDVLIHPSLHDSGSWVCLEAMAAGRPVICLDLGGPALLVTEEAGIKVSALTPKQTIHDLTRAIHRLALDPELRNSMGESGRRRALEFLWDTKGLKLMEIYESIANS